ncbi:hypothetical protein VIGAN_11254600 [Vigna angularis var. angularis]|uniref:Protein kinase domain-containing protein n=1 Tax=Vigna angularis var. angularis TaxID=157739 RepID=A0A0S3TCZ3_PHAAN|nr:hypothetical protein VIGAN_11254600 [Vigna angularis var. angularis]
MNLNLKLNKLKKLRGNRRVSVLLREMKWEHDNGANDDVDQLCLALFITRSGYDPFKCIRYLIFTDFLEVTPGCKNSCFIHQILQTPFQIPFQPLYNNPPIKIVLSTIVLVKPMPEIEQAAAAESTVLFEKYEVERLLGCGAFAKVYHARNTSTGQSVAVKAEDYVYWAST